LFPGLEGSRKAGQVNELGAFEASGSQSPKVENYYIGDEDEQGEHVDSVGSSEKCSRCGKRHHLATQIYHV